MIKKKTDGDMFFLQPDPLYPNDYQGVLEISKQQRSAGFIPSIRTKLNTLDNYQYIFIRIPNWRSTISLSVISFLNEYYLSNKKVIPF